MKYRLNLRLVLEKKCKFLLSSKKTKLGHCGTKAFDCIYFLCTTGKEKFVCLLHKFPIEEDFKKEQKNTVTEFLMILQKFLAKTKIRGHSFIISILKFQKRCYRLHYKKFDIVCSPRQYQKVNLLRSDDIIFQVSFLKYRLGFEFKI